MKRTRLGRIVVIAAFCGVWGGCSSVPSHTDAWLSFKYETQGAGCGAYNYPTQTSTACPGMSDFTEAQNYYNDINAPATLAQWKSTFGFPATGNPPARGLYANYRDLRFGRDMNCVQAPNSQQVACYVTNYAPAPSCGLFIDAACGWPNLEQGVEGAITAPQPPPPPAPITSVGVACSGTRRSVNGGLCTAVFQATNSFAVGQDVQISGLSSAAGSQFDGTTLPVLSASNTQFEVQTCLRHGFALGCATVPQTTDSGTATFFNSNQLATVAMVFNGNPNTSSNDVPNNVTFYVYDQFGNLATSAALDDEGLKSVPRMCMACHGGSYTPHSSTSPATVTGASFLPFDVLSFYYSTLFSQQYGVTAQQEVFRQLNLMVKTTNGGSQPQTANQSAIVDFIDGLYCPDPNNGGVLSNCSTPVENSGSVAVDTYFPTGWAGNQKLYADVIKPYCRMCHLAQPETFSQSSHFAPVTVQSFLCGQNDMPHAEVPFGGPAATADPNGVPYGYGTAANPFIDNSDTSVFWLNSVAQNDVKTTLGGTSCQ